MIYKDTLSIEKVQERVNKGAKLSSSPFDYFSRAWEVVQQNIGNYIGFTLAFFAISILLSFIGGLVQEAAPIVSSIINILSNILNVLILPGYYIFTYKLLNKRNPDFNDFVGGFQYALPLIGQTILAWLSYLIALIPIAAIAYFLIDFSAFASLASLSSEEEMAEALVLLMAESSGTFFLLILVAFVISTLLFIAWLFAPMLIIFSKVGVLEAMNISRKVTFNNIGSFIILFILQIIASILALFTCCIGFLWLIPVIYVTYYLMFNELFGVDQETDETDEILEHLI